MIPDPKGDRWFEKKAVVEALATVPPLLAAMVGALTSLSDQQKRTFGWWLLGGSVWLAAASVTKVLHARAEDRHRRRTEDYEGLRAAMHVLFTSICTRAGVRQEEHTSGRLRVTIHRVVPRARGSPPEELEQLLPYMGGMVSGTGRRFSIRSGIIGKAAREKCFVAATRKNADHEGFMRELVQDWSYTEHDARALSPDRHAWVAVPIVGPRAVTCAVVYLDSREPGFFTGEVKDTILNCCEGIASYTLEAYG
jgi:hypothetical protein